MIGEVIAKRCDSQPALSRDRRYQARTQHTVWHLGCADFSLSFAAKGAQLCGIEAETAAIVQNYVQEIIESGRIVDLMVAFVVIEFVLLLLWRARSGHGIAPAALLVNLCAGGSLMLALGSVLKGYNWQVTAALLVTALVFHVADLRQRWRRAES